MFHCIYDKYGSDRSDWQNIFSGPNGMKVACDSHDNAQFLEDAKKLDEAGKDFMDELLEAEPEIPATEEQPVEPTTAPAVDPEIEAVPDVTAPAAPKILAVDGK